jgi:hypothetical protein
MLKLRRQFFPHGRYLQTNLSGFYIVCRTRERAPLFCTLTAESNSIHVHPGDAPFPRGSAPPAHIFSFGMWPSESRLCPVSYKTRADEVRA